MNGPAAPPAAAAAATVVQLSDAVFARQRGVTSGEGEKDGKPDRRIQSSEEARQEVDKTAGAHVTAAQAHHGSPPDRVFALVFE